MVKSEGLSSSRNAARAAIGDGSESDGDLKRMIVGGVSAFRVASSKAAAPTRATWIGFSEAGNKDEGGDEGEGGNEDEGVEAGDKGDEGVEAGDKGDKDVGVETPHEAGERG